MKKGYENISKDFYLPLFGKSWLLFCLVYSFMLFQFWWGNHDWTPLTHGIKWNYGLFEARYSQHLFTVWLLNGQILPTLYVIISLGLLVVLCLLSADYLCLEKDKRIYLLFTLLLGCSPYTFVLFHYVFITAPMIMWGSVIILLLKLSEGSHTLLKWLLSVIGFAFTLGGYPPNISFLTTMFCGRKVILYQSEKQSIKQIMSDAIFLGSALALGFVINRFIIYILTIYLGISFEMYNMRTSPVLEIVQKIPQEFLYGMQSIAGIYQDLGSFYAFFMLIICIGATIQIIRTFPNKTIAIFGICMIILASRVAYLISANAEYAKFRIGYWIFLGLSAVSLSILLNIKHQIVKNLMFALSLVALFCFIKTDFEIEKKVSYTFNLERLYHKRVEERLFYQPNFDINGSYATLNFGYPDFLSHVCSDGCPNFNNEILDNTTLPADLGYILFWDEIKSPVALKFGIWGKKFWKITDPILKNDWQQDQQSNKQDINMWLYLQSKIYPHQESIYVDDKYILMNLDESDFNKNRGLLSLEIKRQNKKP